MIEASLVVVVVFGLMAFYELGWRHAMRHVEFKRDAEMLRYFARKGVEATHREHSSR